MRYVVISTMKNNLKKAGEKGVDCTCTESIFPRGRTVTPTWISG